MRLALLFALLGATALVIYVSFDLTALSIWAAEQQRGFQNRMAGAIRALQMGEPRALLVLLAAAGAYGFVHAVGPGHGKYLIGGVGLGTAVPASRLLAIALASSLAQALWAIVLVYGGFLLLAVSAQRMTLLAEEILAPASYVAIAAVGLVLVWRGVAALRRQDAQAKHGHHDHEHSDCGCHAHGPTPTEVAALEGLRDTAALIGSIAIRPCTGAIFLLVIAWQMEIQLAGAAAALVMGLGTALLTSAVALSSVAARGVAWASADRFGALAIALPTLQVLTGVFVVWSSLLLLGVRAM